MPQTGSHQLHMLARRLLGCDSHGAIKFGAIVNNCTDDAMGDVDSTSSAAGTSDGRLSGDEAVGCPNDTIPCPKVRR